MNPLLALRLAVSGGREQLLRRAFTATGVGVGVTFLLLAITAPGAARGRAERVDWQDAASAVLNETPDPPAEKADGALFLAVSDYYDGVPMTRAYVAALGADPPVPPGLDRLPGPGELAVSPALRDLLAATPDDELDARFPGRDTLTIGPAGLAHDHELVAIIGRTPEQLHDVGSVAEVHGFFNTSPARGILAIQATALATGSVVLLLPVLVFLVVVTRVAAGQQDRRLAMLRLIGATRAQTAWVAAVETGLAAVAGSALGWAGYEVGRRVAAATVVFQHGHFWAEDVVAPGWALAAVLAGVPVLAVLATLASLWPVQFSPLSVHRRGRRPAPTAWTALPLAVGVAGQLAIGLFDGGGRFDELRPILAVLQVVGVVLVGPWLCLLAAGAIARFSRRAPALIAARRIAYDPRATFRAVAVVALAAMAATYVGSTADRPGPPAANEARRLRPGVVQINTGGVPADRVGPLLSAGTVIERSSAGRPVVACAELRRVRYVTCPHPASNEDLLEPGPGAQQLPVGQLYVPTDGSLAAENRVRTAAAGLVPNAIVNSDRDPVDYHLETLFLDFDRLGGLAALLVLVLGAFGLTAGVIAGLAERRRPFALLRASGVRLAELRLVVLVETTATMLVTSTVGIALGLVAGYAATRGADRIWTWPVLPVLAVVGTGVLAALAFVAFALPLVGIATRQDTVRFE